MRPIVAALTVVLITGCGSSSSESVDWESYSPGVKERIDKAAAAKDCSDLQTEIFMAERNEIDQMNRSGDNNAGLMAYIKAQMVKAGCGK